MSGKIELSFSLTGDDFKRVQVFRYSNAELNLLQRLLRRLGEKVMAGRVQKSEKQRLPSKYEFDENGVSITFGDEVNNAPWAFFNEVVEYDEGYLFISDNAQIQAVIPKRAFTNPDSEKAFRNLLRLQLGLNAKLNSLH